MTARPQNSLSLFFLLIFFFFRRRSTSYFFLLCIGWDVVGGETFISAGQGQDGSRACPVIYRQNGPINSKRPKDQGYFVGRFYFFVPYFSLFLFEQEKTSTRPVFSQLK